MLRPGHLLRGHRLRGKDLREPEGSSGHPSGRSSPAGIYIHFPFCAAKCPYCHFYSLPRSDSGVRSWRAGLEKEAAAAAAGDLRFDTLYIGGGTPSLLVPDDVDAIRRLALDRFPLEIAEFTL
ncbi:MAG: radical SAM protein, partial [Candidatus Aminicenantales bacterium]